MLILKKIVALTLLYPIADAVARGSRTVVYVDYCCCNSNSFEIL